MTPLRAASAPNPEPYQTTRDATERLVAHLTAEDQCVQSMPDASPAKWHRAHTTWFFETFVLVPHAPGYAVFDPAFGYLFNSYYEAVGARHPRPERGLLTRPGAARIGEYRRHVDAAMAGLLAPAHAAAGAEVRGLAELGLQHEQQHQELLVTDMVHAFAQSPLTPAMQPGWREPVLAAASRWIERPGGIGRSGAEDGFRFDCETPRHAVLLAPHAIASQPVRNAEYAGFVADGGYRDARLWTAEGWDAVRQGGWTAPLYWRGDDTAWSQMGPGGDAPWLPDAAVRHISWYEADAYARWAGARLPTEAELEADAPFVEAFFGHVWQWSASAFLPYPGFKPAAGAVGEYNGKFMINQMVLKGGSVATPAGHSRPSYRNFFHPAKRWQFSGLRLAKEL